MSENFTACRLRISLLAKVLVFLLEKELIFIFFKALLVWGYLSEGGLFHKSVAEITVILDEKVSGFFTPWWDLIGVGFVNTLTLKCLLMCGVDFALGLRGIVVRCCMKRILLDLSSGNY